ncbi:hypothetical protein ScPMuIL_018752 [Solemya velum]
MTSCWTVEECLVRCQIEGCCTNGDKVGLETTSSSGKNNSSLLTEPIQSSELGIQKSPEVQSLKAIMCTQWIGSIVSLDCGETLGTYQGQVRTISSDCTTLQIVGAYRNGLRCEVPDITIRASDIRDLKILKPPKEAVEILKIRATPHKLQKETDEGCSLPSPGKVREVQCIGVETDSINGHLTNGQSNSQRYTPTKDRYSEKHRNGYKNNNCNNNNVRYSPNEDDRDGYKNGCNNNQRCSPSEEEGDIRPRRNSTSEIKLKKSTPRKIENRRKGTPRQDCFSAPVNNFFDEFDFEKNLALFDKKAVFEEIENSVFADPKASDNKKMNGKYKCDENVLRTSPVELQQIKVPNGMGKDYVTDSGLVVPVVTYELRNKLFSVAEKYGFTLPRRLEMVGRSAAEMILQLLGGSHRLNPQNGHQLPTVVVLCGTDIQAAAAVNCARQLSNHGVKTIVFVPNLVKMAIPLEEELKLYDLCDGRKIMHTKDLTSGPVDIIINATECHENNQLQLQGWYKALVDWAGQSRAPVLAIDPPINSRDSITAKWCLGICLPLNLQSNSSQTYLCDLGFPRKVFSEVGIKYMSPFSHKFIIPIHPRS